MIQTITKPENGRQHFELAIANVAMVSGCTPRSLRDKIKFYMKKRGEIAESTTELSDAELHEYAGKLMAFYNIFTV